MAVRTMLLFVLGLFYGGTYHKWWYAVYDYIFKGK
jgi:hypothetical protein